LQAILGHLGAIDEVLVVVHRTRLHRVRLAAMDHHPQRAARDLNHDGRLVLEAEDGVSSEHDLARNPELGQDQTCVTPRRNLDPASWLSKRWNAATSSETSCRNGWLTSL